MNILNSLLVHLYIDMDGFRRKHVTYYPGVVYKTMNQLAGSTATKVEV